MTDARPGPDARPEAGSATAAGPRNGSRGIDPRGPRVAAGITCAVLALALVTGSVWVLAAQVIVFAVGSLFGVQRSPYAWIYRRLVRPRLGPPPGLEDPAAPRFAQSVGLAVTGAALVPAVLGVDPAVSIGAGLAFVAAFLNASIDYCLGCKLYLLLARVRHRIA